jgi:hypothetical protein
MMPDTDNSVPVPQQEPAERAQASWRGTLKIHPACNLIPPMSAGEVRDLGENILKKGLISPITLWLASKDAQAQLLDGRSRLDALELALGRPVRVTSHTSRGRTTWDLEADDDGDSVPVLNLIGDEGFPFGTRIEYAIVVLDSDTDPYEYVKSVNIHRRHLTAKKKREAIANLIKATPGKSDRQIAKTVKASPTFVGKVRAEMEATGEVSTVDTRIDAKGVKQPARKVAEAKGRKPRNLTGSKIHREMELGADTVAALDGTTLASAREQDELVFLNRGASEGELTESVRDLVACAARGEKVSAIEYTKSGAAFRREKVSAGNSASECTSLRARIDEQQTSIEHFVSQCSELRRQVKDLEAKQKPFAPDSIATLSDAELTEALVALGFERFLRVMPAEWRPKLGPRAGGQKIGRAKAWKPKLVGGTN